MKFISSVDQDISRVSKANDVEHACRAVNSKLKCHDNRHM